MYFEQTYECMERGKLEDLQLKRLRDTVKRVYENVPHYRKQFDELGVTPDNVQSLDDLRKLPFTTKEDLRLNYPFGLFAVPMTDIVRVHASSGTTGKPTVVGYTSKDIDVWADLMARSMALAGADRSSVIQVAYGYGLFTGGLGAHYGAERLGATVVPVSGGNSKRQIMLMQDFGTNLLACTPSYAIFLAETMEQEGVKLEEMKLKYGLFGAEPWSQNMRLEIERRLHIRASDVYGLSEIMGPGVACECEFQCGLHIQEDCFIPEIIDSKTGEVKAPGEEGELAITTINKEGLPLIRYRTRDITSLNRERCRCGRTHARINRVRDRSDDMLIIRGVNVFPSQIEKVIVGIEGLEPHYMIIVDRQGSLDSLEVLVELSDAIVIDQVRQIESLRDRVCRELESMLGISVRLTFAEPKSIKRSEGKAQRVIDKRKK